MSQDTPGSMKSGDRAADVLHEVSLQLQVVEQQCKTTKSQFAALREHFTDDGDISLEQTTVEGTSIKQRAEAIKTDTLQALHQDLPDIVIEAPEVIPDDEMVDQLDDTAAHLIDQHEQLMDTVDQLSTLLEDESKSAVETEEIIDKGVTQVDRIMSSANRLQRLIEEIAPGVEDKPEEGNVVWGRGCVESPYSGGIGR